MLPDIASKYATAGVKFAKKNVRHAEFIHRRSAEKILRVVATGGMGCTDVNANATATE